MNNPFTEEEDKIIKQHRKSYTNTQLSQLLVSAGFAKRSSDSIRHRSERLGLSKGPGRILQPLPQQMESITETISKVFANVKSKVKKSESKKATKPKKHTTKILSLSDWHIPFERRDLVEEITALHSDADIVVVNGDFLDMYAASSFPKFKNIPLLKEYNIGLKYLEQLSKAFPRVVLTQGNHEQRLSRLFMKEISREVSSLVCTDVLTRLANGEEYNYDGSISRLLDFKNVEYDTKTKWYTLIGKTLFVHPSSYISAPGGTVLKAMKYFEGRFPFDSVVMGHTHMLCTCVYNGRLLIEQGCFAKPLEYQISSDLKYGIHANGYAVVYQDEDGNTDFKESRAFLLDTSAEK